MTAIKRRAISDSQKQARQQAILDAALALFEEQPYQELTLETVAKKVGVARATLYLYFKTREELFLAVLEQLYEKWYATISDSLKALLAKSGDKLPTIPQVVDLITDGLVEHWTTVRLSVLLPTVLEQNVEYNTVLQFKRNLLANGVETSLLLEKALPFLRSGQGAQFLLRVQTIINGLQPFCEPSAVVKQLLQEPDMAILRTDFRQECAALLRALLYGIEHENAITQINTDKHR